MYPQSISVAGATVQTSTDTIDGVRTVIVDGVTDATGMISFDLSSFDINDLFDWSVVVLDGIADLANIIRGTVLSITATAASVILYGISAVTVPLVAVGAGVNARLVIMCK